MFEILELEPPNRPPPDEVIAMCADEASRIRLADALAMATTSGIPWDLELPMFTVGAAGSGFVRRALPNTTEMSSTV